MAENSGIIPAYAGLTPARALPCSHPRDHPRLRGVNGLVKVTDGWYTGSSPLTRG